MRLCFILSSLWLSGGVRDIVETSNRLIQRGHSVCFVAPGGTLDKDVMREIDDGIEVREISVSGVGPISLFRMIRLTLALARAVPQSDIVISTQSPTTAAGFIATSILKKGKPVWYYQDYREMFLDRPIIELLLKNALRWHEGALVLSESSRAELLQYVSNKKVVVSGMGLSHASFFRPYSKEERSQYKQERKTLLFLGDMRPRKGWDDFLKAAKLVHQEYPNILLWIVSKETCAIQTDVPYEYIYRPSRKELAHLCAICDVFVSASWWESFGIPPLEAMACGAPVVMTDSRGGREYARSGENCLLVPAQRPEALAKAILQVLYNSELEERLRANGPKMAAQFTWVSATDRFEKVLTEIHES